MYGIRYQSVKTRLSLTSAAGVASELSHCNFLSKEAAALCLTLTFSSIPEGCTSVRFFRKESY